MIERVFADMKEKHGMPMDHLTRTWQGVHVGDARFRLHELEKTSHLALEVR